jgi:LuxR family maltose regulon positive regulatory protein
LAKLRQDDFHSINRWTSSLTDILQSENPYQFENELILSTLARVKYARNDPEGGLDLLTLLESHAKSGGRDGRLIGILCLQALAQEDLGESAQASSALRKALALAEPGGYVRTVIDEGEPMRRLLARWASRAEAGALKEYANYLVSQFQHESLPKEMGLSGGKLIEPLSPREIEVLTHIASGRTNKEIAQELIISPGTVKAHTSSIYRKLDAANRTEAVARARELDILS